MRSLPAPRYYRTMGRLSEVRSRLGRVLPGDRRRHALVGPSEDWVERRAFQIEFLRAQGLTPDDRLVDIGCGTLRGGIPLIEYLDAGCYVGIEVRASVLAEGKKELAKYKLGYKRPELILADSLAMVEIDGPPFDVAWAFSVLIHMTDSHLNDCLAFLSEHLSPRGSCFASANIGSRNPSRWAEFPVVWRTLEEYGAAAAAARLTVESLGPLKDLGYSPPGGDQLMLRFARSG